MHVLSDSELAAVRSTLEPICKKREVIALCAYGSQVAGYATKESDYDVILVLRPFAQRIKYYYLSGKTDCSALVVDPKSFSRDCEKSSLGEFVAGRLLNVYYPIDGTEFLKISEIAFKKRVILEGLFDAYAEYLDFASQIRYPLQYFLFEKLRKRATIYPPVVYSYSKTYGEDLLALNTESSLEGFRRAAVELEGEGLISFDGKRDSVSVLPKYFHGGISARLEAMASYTTKSLTQYAIHGYAGRVTPKVVGKEVISKISRSRKSSRLPELIRSPKKVWSLPTGKLFISTANWLSDLVDSFGMNLEDCRITRNSLGEFYNSAGFYTIENSTDGAKTRWAITVAVKRFKDIKGMKWGVLSLWSLKNANFAANSLERLFREYRGIRVLRTFGLCTPDVLAVFLSQRIMVTRFVKGRDLSKIESDYLSEFSENLEPIQKFGADLAVLHNNDYCMGDTKPSNVVLSDTDARIYFTDLEQSTPSGNKTWDLAEFVYYSVRFTLKEERARRLVGAFVQGYLSKAEDARALDEAAALRYRAPFQAFIAPNVMNALRKDLRS